MNFISINDLNNIIKNNMYKIQNKYDLIVSVPRSGCLPATLIALYLNLPLTDIDNLLNNKLYCLGKSKVKESWITNIEEAKRILIVEDSSFSGDSVNEVRKKLSNYKFKDKCDILSIIVTSEATKSPDIYFKVCEAPRMFEWNYLHHKMVKDACFDLDGVLCENPTVDENDDGEKYINFIKNAKPRYIPTFEIGKIVTTRLEKYRSITEEWLKNNNIKYKELIMLDLPSKEDRIRLNQYGRFKAKHYKNDKKLVIFIESDINQAIEIAEISKKSVFCTDTSEFISETYRKKYISQKKHKYKQKVKQTTKKIIGEKNYNRLKRIIKRET